MPARRPDSLRCSAERAERPQHAHNPRRTGKSACHHPLIRTHLTAVRNRQGSVAARRLANPVTLCDGHGVFFVAASGQIRMAADSARRTGGLWPGGRLRRGQLRDSRGRSRHRSDGSGRDKPAAARRSPGGAVPGPGPADDHVGNCSILNTPSRGSGFAEPGAGAQLAVTPLDQRAPTSEPWRAVTPPTHSGCTRPKIRLDR